VSMNARNTDHITIENWIDNALLIFKGGRDLSWNVRDALTDCETFQCAYDYLLKAEAVAPGYLIMAGIERYEGVVISRDRQGPAHVAQLSEETWFIAQTNDDSWAGECQTRCQAAQQHVKDLGVSGISAERLINEVILVGPTLNKMTIFSSLMIPKEKRLDAYWVDSDYPYYD